MITETERLAAIAEADRSILKQEVRSYEVSLWTLQDEFITVLKWSDVEQKTRIQDPDMKLSTDEIYKFSFSIPMYLEFYENGQRIVKENPIWYTTQDGSLMANMRKIKVVFNKNTTDEAVFELVIVKVTEEHESDQLTCKVECESLAFHELGKIGYKYSLTEDDFLVNLQSWHDNGYWMKPDGETKCYLEPEETIDYWCEQCFLRPYGSDPIPDPRKWYYKVDMNWGSFDQTADDSSGNDVARLSTKVYEESYATSWDADLKPQRSSIQAAREKNRPISVSQSNVYNITQSIAEAFNVYCRYEYGHDANQHITSRTVVFYNNYIREDLGLISFTYPYTSKSVSRELDSTDLITKMYVTPQDDSTILSGNISITDSPANKLQEDYLLNFDYMYKCGAITQEQYDAIFEYEKAVRANNIAFTNVTTLLDGYYTSKTDLEAEISVLEDAIGLEQEQIDSYSPLYNRIDAADGSADGYFERTPDSNYRSIAMVDSGSNVYYIKFNQQDKGIKEDTIKCYKTYSAKESDVSNKLSNRITITKFDYDEYGDIVKAYFNTNTFNTNESKMVYTIYKYSPKLYYESVANQWQEKKDEDEARLAEVQAELDTLNENIADAEEERDTLKAEKTKLVREFEAMMGPALREGYWSPNAYQDRGEQKTATAALPEAFNTVNMLNDAGDGMLVGWDNVPFDDEEPLYYEEGAARKPVYYPCIDISDREGTGEDWFTRIRTMMEGSTDRLSFIWQNNYYKDLSADEESSIANISNMTLGGRMELGFMRVRNVIKPILILKGAKTMTEEEIKFMLTTGPSGNRHGHPRICMFNTEIRDTSVHVSIKNPIEVKDWSRIYWYPAKMADVTVMEILSGPVQDITADYIERVFPRFKFSNSRLRTTSGYLAVTYNNYNGNAVLLERYEDYSVVPRTTIRNDGSGALEYYGTIKPEVLLKAGTYSGMLSVHYTFSNAATSIYLDAKEILKENSMPRASYEVSINVLNKEYMRILYSMLAQIVIINDTDLKFSEQFGYISEVNLKLDKPWEDTIGVKNYKTKFEDLFTMIVAQTEQMKQNSMAYGQAATGNVTLTTEALSDSLASNSEAMQNFFDTYFDGSEAVREKLKDLFTEAGQLLSEANSELNNVQTLTYNNYDILEGFTTNIKENLTPQVFNSVEQPTVFKVGDIWNKFELVNGNSLQLVARYVATSSSEDGNGGGWTRTYDGSLAAIKGAGMDIDAVEGKINLYAENELNIQSGGNLEIAANDNVTILGNKEVNIGGTTINIAAGVNNTRFNVTVTRATFKAAIHEVARVYWFKYKAINGGAWTLDNKVVSLEDYGIHVHSATEDPVELIPDEDYIYIWYDDTKSTIDEQINWLGADTVSYGSINLVATGLSDLSDPTAVEGAACVNISPVEIHMATSHLRLEASSNIDLLASTGNNTSVIRLNSENGIYIASGKAITFFTGNDYTSGTSAEFTKDHILMGVTANNSTTAFKLTSTYLLMATGNSLNGMPVDDVVLDETHSMTGMKLTKESFGLAIGTSTSRTVILADANGITVGTGSDPKGSNHVGSYVTVSGAGVDIGTSGNLYLNTNNIKLQSDPTYGTRFALGNNMNGVSPVNTDSINTIDNIASNVGLVYNTNGLFINGKVYAQELLAISGDTKFKANASQIGFYQDTTNPTTGVVTEVPILTIDTNSLIVANGYNLDIQGDLNITTAHNGNLNVATTNVVIDSSARLTEDETMFRLGPAANPVLNYIHGNLTINAAGDITIGAGSKLSVNGGTLEVKTDNVLIDTSATGANPTFRIGTSTQPQILYSPTGGLAVNKITATDGTIGGWAIGATSLTSGSISLSSSGTYAINCADKFMVDFNGNVWIKALYVDGHYIDFTKAFEQAISVSLAWDGNGTTASVKATVVGWGVLNCVKTISSTITLPNEIIISSSSYALGYGSFSVPIIATLDGSNNTVTFELSGQVCNATAIVQETVTDIMGRLSSAVQSHAYQQYTNTFDSVEDAVLMGYHDNGSPNIQLTTNSYTITTNAVNISCAVGTVTVTAKAYVGGHEVCSTLVTKQNAYRTYHSVPVSVATATGSVATVDYSNHVTVNGVVYYAEGSSVTTYSISSATYYLPD